MTEYKWLPSEPSKEMKKYVNKYQSIADYKQMWQAAPKVEQEPVGYADAESITYLLEGGDSGILIVPEPTDTRDTPLYVHSPKRKTLSDEKCWELIHSLSTPNGQHSLLQLVRWVEKAHGIEANNG